MTDTMLYVTIAAAVLILIVVLILLARSGRKPVEGPVEERVETGAIDRAAEFAPVLPDEPLPEPAAASGLVTIEQPPEQVTLATTDGAPDQLTRMKGLGPKAAAILATLGVTRYAQIAAWTPTDVARVDAAMGTFKGRIERDRWVEQARFLAAGDIAGFEERFGKLG